MPPSKELLEWFDRRARPLPWRETDDPYLIWVSEIMLQQTRVETALPYYRRFVERFPGVDELAAAEEDEVLSLWSGLGYYGRARRLHETARRLAPAGGRFPETVEGLLELPGVGAYTAAAVASIAFGVVTPVLDGNVERVMARWIGLDQDPRRAAARRELLAAAGSLLTPERPGDGNQALMELGATVCLPRRPDCGACPLSSDCVGLETGNPERYPAARARRAAVRLRRVSAVARRGPRVLLVRRPDASEVLPGAWETPWVDWVGGRGADRKLAHGLALRYGGEWTLGPSRGWVRHSITYRAFEVEVREANLVSRGAVAEAPEARWFLPREIERIHVSSLLKKILAT